MRIHSCFILAAFLLAPGVFAAHAGAPATAGKPQRTISVSGEAEVRAAPDEVLVSLTAEHRGAELMATKKRNDQAVEAFIAYATKDLGVAAEHIQTDYVSIEPAYRQCSYSDEIAGRCNPLDIVYYSVRKGIQVRLNDLAKYETLVTQALALGVSHIDNVQFLTTALRRHRDTARELAARASREKAEAIAATLGMKVAKPVTVSDQSFSSFYWHGSGFGARGRQSAMTQNVVQSAPGGGGAEGAFALGQINITATVQAVYELE